MIRLPASTQALLFSGIAAAYLCGAFTAFSGFLPVQLVAAFFVSSFCMVVISFWKKNSGMFLCTTLAFSFFLAYWAADNSFQPPRSPRHIYNLVTEQMDGVVICRLKKMPAVKDDFSYVTLETSYLRTADSTNYTPCKGDLQLSMRFDWPGQYEPGQWLAVRASLSRPAGYNTPGSFDYPAYLARQGIWITGSLRSPAQLAPVQATSSFIHTLRFLPEKIRTRSGHFIDAHLSRRDHQGLYRALLLGDRSSLPPDLYEQYKAAGIAHILAISGLHVSLIGSLLYICWYWVLRRSEYIMLNFHVRKWAVLLALPPLFWYALLAGTGSPVMRATIMTTAVTLILWCDRPKSMGNIFFLAALLLVTTNPQKLYSASFQLSFAAIGSILITLPFLRNIHDRFGSLPLPRWGVIPWFLLKWATLGLLTSTAAVLGTAPLVIYHFHRLPLAGPLATLLVEPLICLWTLPLGFLSLLLMPFAPEATVLALKAGGISISIANALAACFASFDSFNLWLPSPPIVLILCYYASFFLIPYAFHLGRTTGATLSMFYLLTLFFLLAPHSLPPLYRPNTPRITFIDVGQGSATLIELASGRTLLIDGGGSAYPTPAAGEKILAPYLWSLGLTKLDGIILTHPDADHYNGLSFLVRRFSPDFLWTCTDNSDKHDYMELLRLCRRNGVAIHVPQSGAQLEYDDGVLTCLLNCRKEQIPGRNNGLVIRLTVGDLSLLFPGDIERETEQELLSRAVPLKSDILLAAHHGSSTSNTPAFLDGVTPQVIIVSAGVRKKTSYPSPALLRESRDRTIALFATHAEGTLQLRNSGSRFRLYSLARQQNNPLHRHKEQQLPMPVQ